ncbi:MAG TPA: calcium-binding protein [Roseomonas sp.]|nr:calcium-binding protein [Roseomonas sp.]
MALLSLTLPSGPLTVPENGQPEEAFGIVGIASGLLSTLNLATLRLTGEDAELFGLNTANLASLGQVEIYARQPFDFEDAEQRNFSVILQADLLAPLPLLGDLLTLSSDPISITVTDTNDNPPESPSFLDGSTAANVLANVLGATIGDLTAIDLDTVGDLVFRVLGPDADLVTIEGNTLKLLDTVSLTAGQTLDLEIAVSDGLHAEVSVPISVGALPPGGGSNVQSGGPGDDTIPGTDGPDIQLGNGGNDVLVGSPGADVLDGGPGTDTADYSGSPAAVTVDLTAGTGSGGDAEGDTLTSVEIVIGSNFDDTLTGKAGADSSLFGGGGNDTLIVMPGNEFVDGGSGTDTAVLSQPLASYEIQNLGQRIIISNADGTATLTGIEQIRFADGALNFADGDDLFDPAYYGQNNYDVYLSGTDPRQHYDLFGRFEGRDPNALFSTTGYLSANPDVAAADLNPLEHFRTFGWKEGRDPSAAFDVQHYLAQNADVQAAGINPLEHYLAFGAAEGRAVAPAVGSVIVNDFDAEYYLLANPDVGAAGLDPFEHYLNFGAREGRDPNGYFDTDRYLARYADVAESGINPLMHYVNFGWKEGRDPSANFDAQLYLAANPDVAAAQVDPLSHYLQFGSAEGREAFSDGVLG